MEENGVKYLRKGVKWFLWGRRDDAHGPDGVVVGQFLPCELCQGGAGGCVGKVLFGGGYHAALLRPDALHQDPVRPRGRKLPSGMVLPLLLFDFPTG